MRRAQWVDENSSVGLRLLAADDRRSSGGAGGGSLPPGLILHAVAPFLRFDAPLPNQLYALGGRNQQQDPLDKVEMFDTWHGRWVTCPDMLERRAGCAAAALPCGRLLVVGGYDERGIVQGLLDSCEAFDPEAQKWTTCSARLGRARWGHGCASLGGLVYVVGGCSLQPGAPPHEALMETLHACEVYDPELDVWRQCADLHVARAGSRVVALNDRCLAAVGGCDDVFGRAELLPTVELFDVLTGQWSLLDVHLSTPRTTAAVAALDHRQILIIGGAPNLSSAEVFQVPCSSESSRCVEDAAGEVSPSRKPICDMAEGRMGCQAVAIDLPASGQAYPLCTQQCVVVVGGENGGDEETSEANIRQFSSVLVFDVKADRWRAEDSFPPIPTPRTAMALCVGPGKITGHPC